MRKTNKKWIIIVCVLLAVICCVSLYSYFIPQKYITLAPEYSELILGYTPTDFVINKDVNIPKELSFLKENAGLNGNKLEIKVSKYQAQKLLKSDLMTTFPELKERPYISISKDYRLISLDFSSPEIDAFLDDENRYDEVNKIIMRIFAINSLKGYSSSQNYVIIQFIDGTNGTVLDEFKVPHNHLLGGDQVDNKK